MTTLHIFAGACSLVPHIVARELNNPLAIKAAPKSGEAGRDAYIKEVNSLGSVPALQLEGGDCLTQNVAIVEYLVGQAEAQGFSNLVYPKLGTREHAEALRWLCFANSDLHPAYNPIFAPQRFSSDAATHADLAKQAKARLEQLYSVLNTAYTGKQWLANNSYSAADVYVYVTLRWAKMVGVEVAQWPELTQLMQRVQARPAVQLALKEEGLTAV